MLDPVPPLAWIVVQVVDLTDFVRQDPIGGHKVLGVDGAEITERERAILNNRQEGPPGAKSSSQSNEMQQGVSHLLDEAKAKAGIEIAQLVVQWKMTFDNLRTAESGEVWNK